MGYDFCGAGGIAVGVEGDFSEDGLGGVCEIEGGGVGEEFYAVDAETGRAGGEHEGVGVGDRRVSGQDIGEPDDAAVGISG